MTHGRDLRNKLALLEDKIYIIGGPGFYAESYNYLDKKWDKLTSYEKYIHDDNLDSWACT